MSKSESNKITVFALLALSLVAIFSPDVGPTSRFLAVEETSGLYATTPSHTPPPGMRFSCPAGQQAFTVDWTGVPVSTSEKNQTVTFANGMSATLSIIDTGAARASGWAKDANGFLTFSVRTTCDASDIITRNASVYPDYPDDYSTMELTFDRELFGLYVSISNVDSGPDDADVVRVRFYDAAHAAVETTFSMTGFVHVQRDYGFSTERNLTATKPGFEASLYARANGRVKTISLDQSLFCFALSGDSAARTTYPALDFAYCAPTMASTPEEGATPAVAINANPTSGVVVVEPSPVTSPVSLPVEVTGTSQVTVQEALNVTVPEPDPLPQTVTSTQAPAFTAGVIGDSLILGLSGQRFKFNGRSGAWYSAISSQPFQWNMKIQHYESCPSDANNFVSAVGLTFMEGSKKRRIEVNVANAYNVGVGCGADAVSHCLGFGSLELLIDGLKHVVGGEYTFKDGTGRIVAFNTYYPCSRKWYDFDVRQSEGSETSLRAGRRLDQLNVFDVIDGLKDTMIDGQACDPWINERKLYGDLYMQPGHHSTIIVETADITLHFEYKQENERCDAHSIDVWISSVSPSLLEETWEGVVGETKNLAIDASGKQNSFNRMDVLKFSDDADYEVKSPFDNKCKGCVN